MSENVATVGCAIDIYPFEGENYTLTDAQVTACSVQAGIDSGAPGTFNMTLAPGGPAGVDDPNTWAMVITPMSLVVIAMQRGSRAQVVMVGVVQTPAEILQWGDTVVRQQSIQGYDFTAFFTQFNWATFSTVGATAETLIGQALGTNSGGAIAQQLSPALIGIQGSQGATPSTIAQAWFNLMMGPGSIMGQTVVPYKSTQYNVHNLFATRWENYLTEQGLTVPMGDFLATVDGTWMSKFKDLLPDPWYEFFIITAPQNAYSFPGMPAVSGSASATSSTGVASAGSLQFASSGMPYATPAMPTIVSRVKPLPALTLTVSNPQDSGTFGNLDMARWNALPLFQPDSGVILSQQTFPIDEAQNVYFVSPKWIYANMMGTGTDIVPTTFLFIMGADPASIHRYGYRPMFMSTPWLYDPVYAGTNLEPQNMAQLMATLLARLMSYFHPTALMAKAVVVLPLRPDIMPGCRFTYQPSKSDVYWDYYIDNVQHNYNFGGDSVSTTTLTLSRGLPSIIYQSGAASGSFLNAIHMGDAMRQGGEYTIGVPSGLGPTLQTVVPLNSANLSSFLGGIASIYVSAQAK